MERAEFVTDSFIVRYSYTTCGENVTLEKTSPFVFLMFTAKGSLILLTLGLVLGSYVNNALR